MPIADNPAPIVQIGVAIKTEVLCSIVRQDGETVRVLVRCDDGKVFTMVEYPRDWVDPSNLTLMQFEKPK